MAGEAWRVRCLLYGLKGHPLLGECGTLLRGISALYGDGFDFIITSLDDENGLKHVVMSLSLPPDTASRAVQEPFIRAVCMSGEMTDEIVATGIEEIARALRAVVERQLQGTSVIIGRSIAAPPATAEGGERPIRMFVSGDRSQVGKSTCCLGLVGSLLQLGYKESEIAYIKPATQCEQTQLIAKFCRHHNITCCDIGPIVFYSGFTREFLKGNTESSQELLAKARAKVEEVGRGKKVVVVDGVGYPAVGSICGVSNAAVALAVDAPVVLVGKRGVGDAVDSFNLNAQYFESQGVQVLGAIFNRLPLDGFYSLENCRESVTLYFQQYQPEKNLYGFIPEIPERSEGEAMLVDDACCNSETFDSEHITRDELQRANQVISLFSQSVNVARLVEDAKSFQQSPSNRVSNGIPTLTPLNKRPLVSISQGLPAKKSRQEIQAAAKASGAAGG